MGKKGRNHRILPGIGRDWWISRRPECMSLVADSISDATPRRRSRTPPESSSWCRNTSNCFSRVWTVGEEGAEEPLSPPAIEVKREGLAAETATYLGRSTSELRWGLGFKERKENASVVQMALRNADFMFGGGAALHFVVFGGL